MFYNNIFVLLFSYYVYMSNCSNVTNPNHISEIFISLLNKNETQRIHELKDKLSKIDSFVVDRDQYVGLLVNTSKSNDLNQTNFYKALFENDNLKPFDDINGKSLYLKLKEKLNRDDLLTILAERGENKLRRSARRMRMVKENHNLYDQHERKLAEEVDKYLAETPTDDHDFDKDDNMLSNYWDPETEWREREEHQRLKSRRIFKGERTTIRNYPFMVSVHVMGSFWCGGVLYWRDIVITSASCLQLMYNNRMFRENPKSLQIRMGSNHSLTGGEMIGAIEVFFHPSYNPKTLNNNIALIRLHRQIKFSHRHRIPKMIQISHNEGTPPYTAEVMLLGWGVRKAQLLPLEPIFLERKFLPIYPNVYCKEIYGDKFNPKTMFCAGTLTTGEGACHHDAGGPAVLNGKLVGIISYGPTVCGAINSPTVLTLVGAYADWIENMNETMPSYYRTDRETTTTRQDPWIRMGKHRYYFKYSTDLPPRDITSFTKNEILRKKPRKSKEKDTNTKSNILKSYFNSETSKPAQIQRQINMLYKHFYADPQKLRVTKVPSDNEPESENSLEKELLEESSTTGQTLAQQQSYHEYLPDLLLDSVTAKQSEIGKFDNDVGVTEKQNEIGIFDYDVGVTGKQNERGIFDNNIGVKKKQNEIGIFDDNIGVKEKQNEIGIFDDNIGVKKKQNEIGIFDDNIGVMEKQNDNGIFDDNIGVKEIQNEIGIFDDNIGIKEKQNQIGIFDDNIGVKEKQNEIGIFDDNIGVKEKQNEIGIFDDNVGVTDKQNKRGIFDNDVPSYNEQSQLLDQLVSFSKTVENKEREFQDILHNYHTRNPHRRPLDRDTIKNKLSRNLFQEKLYRQLKLPHRFQVL